MKYDTGRREAQQHGRGWCKVIQGKAAFQEVCSRVAKFAWSLGGYREGGGNYEDKETGPSIMASKNTGLQVPFGKKRLNGKTE